ncbi:MAG: DsrE family protein [Myxococcales bacterium]|nr:DsrE family protein [Myxococcota bacterium]MDW8282937.1 DsrE family protein [Myxococcales bacterium]
MSSRLGILLASGPEEGDLPLVEAVARAALAQGRQVGLFLMDAGCSWALDGRLQALIRDGVEATICAMDAEARGLDVAAIAAAGVHLGSQHDHARLVRDSHRFLCFA